MEIVRCPDCGRRAGSAYHQMACGDCTCPSLPSQPLARTGSDPGCPIHGETP